MFETRSNIAPLKCQLWTILASLLQLSSLLFLLVNKQFYYQKPSLSSKSLLKKQFSYYLGLLPFRFVGFVILKPDF